MTDDLSLFAENVEQEIIRLKDEQGLLYEDAFMTYFTELLADHGEVEDVMIAFKRERGAGKRRGYKVNGYSVNVDDSLHLFVSLPKTEARGGRIGRTDIDAAIGWLTQFVELCFDGLHKQLEPTDVARDMCEDIAGFAESETRIVLHLITDGKISARELHIPKKTIGLSVASFRLWDIERFHRLETSGRERENIEITVRDYLGRETETDEDSDGIPALLLQENAEYRTFLASIPATFLYNVYEEYGPMLLERNVRSYLQARGTVNKGILKTIVTEPERFSAYNNGLSCTADSIQFDDTGSLITHISGLQIVNGAQTTASIHRAKTEKADIENILVQAKFTEVGENVPDELFADISRFSNTQNKIATADFSANHPFHAKVEEISRSVWAPATDGTQKQSRWFYERSRGQYAEEKAKKVRGWEEDHPNRQKFVKTDLAKYENSWSGKPHLVSRGAQKNFVEFMENLDEDKVWAVDEFKDHIAKQILFRETDRVVKGQNYGGYKAQVVTYTVAVLARSKKDDINLKYWWQQQKLPDDVIDAVINVSKQVFDVITDPPGNANISEYCKDPKCWTRVKAEVMVSQIKIKKVRSVRVEVQDESTQGTVNLSIKQLKHKAVADCLSAEVCTTLVEIYKETGQLSARERGILTNIAKYKQRGQELSPRLLHALVQIIMVLIKSEGLVRLAHIPGLGDAINDLGDLDPMSPVPAKPLGSDDSDSSGAEAQIKELSENTSEA